VRIREIRGCNISAFSAVKNRNKGLKTMLFFEKNQKIGLFLGRFYVFFRVFKPKNTVQQGAS
jgi:hypothetical protein